MINLEINFILLCLGKKFWILLFLDLDNGFVKRI